MANKKRTNDGPADKAYTAERRWEKNKARNIANEVKRVAKNAAKAPARALKRIKGALARIDRRIAAAKGDQQVARLAGVRARIAASGAA